MKKRISFGLLLICFLFCSACDEMSILFSADSTQQNRIATLNPTVPIPNIPTLPVMQPTPTSVSQSNIFYESYSDIFSRLNAEQIPDGASQTCVIAGVISKTSANELKVRRDSGEIFSILCDDSCFAVNEKKQNISLSALSNGQNVIVFGVSSEENAIIINADAIAVYGVPAPHGGNASDMTHLVYPLIYSETKLKSAPLLKPLRLDPIEGSLDENIAYRGKTTFSKRSEYIYRYGYSGEEYSTWMDYNHPENRDPLHPTRAQMTLYSNDYEFFDFWYPSVPAPMSTNWGILIYRPDWILQYRPTVDIDPAPDVIELIYTDRTMINQKSLDLEKNYIRSFGSSILGDSLIYFYQNDSGYGISINHQDYDLGFDEIPFALLEQYADLNPFYADDIVSFFGLRSGEWVYAELKDQSPSDLYY